MKWNLEELTEDALVAYLQGLCPGEYRISAAWARDEIEYPAVLVHAESSEPISEPAEWHDPRQLSVSVAVVTEGAHEIDPTSGLIIKTARERNQEARSAVMDALFVSDLNAQLVAQGVEDIAFSMAQFADTQRSTEDRNLITTITGTVIAEPVTGS